jgi:hypothetical protein
MKRIKLLTFLIVLFTVFQPIRAAIDLDSLKQEIIQNTKEIQELRKDSILFSKLTSEQIVELKRNELQVKQNEIESRGQSEMPLNGFGIVMIVLIPFVFAIIILLIVGKIRNAESERKYALYLKSLEMGQAIPDHFFDTPKKVKNESNLKTGIILLAIGLGFVTLYVFVHYKIAIMLGIFLAFLGIGYLLVHLLDKPKKVDEQNG